MATSPRWPTSTGSSGPCCGDQIGYRTRLGVTPDGLRSAVVSMSTQFLDSLDATVAQDRAARTLIDRAICG